MRIAACAADLELWLPGTEMVAMFAEDAGHEVVRIAGKEAPRTPDLFHPFLPAFPEGVRFEAVLVNVMTPVQKWWLWLHRDVLRAHADRIIVGGQSAPHLSVRRGRSQSRPSPGGRPR